ncbi:uncharacterized protein BP5553_01227 [Venustampulla echinocandica]|uniref:Ubiquitin-like modifier HUB1 n=1 Tax=Venustampulla echinocandica TaxID=2656787 RepID=A0A370U0F1_9HELO|nr:uncharacterized protein BP5553_01227 [Venustampulla echinocandica]RDL41248.1 hypothetical protein BP5553_01227 [Venustampulla echinocandica]
MSDRISSSGSRSPRRLVRDDPSSSGRHRSRSRSPHRRSDNDRDRDRNGDGRREKPRASGGGFKWKEKRRDNNNMNEDRDGREKRLERGYRNRSPRRDRDREREQKNSGVSVEDKFGVADKFGPSSTSSSSKQKESSEGTAKEKIVPPAPVATHGEPMIIVHVNDRLGTKAAIPCLASDPIKLFKAQVAARIGRQPHEILLKRQGERPFKDQLSLEDYGVSNGVQIDLEIDTGE